MRSLLVFRRVISYYRQHLPATLAGAASVVASGLVSLVAPGLIRRAIDALSARQPLAAVAHYAAGLLLVALVAGLFLFLQRWLLVGVSRHLEHHLRVELYQHLLRLPPRFYLRERVGDLLTRATSDVGAVRMAIGPAFMYALSTVTILIASTVLMARISVPMTLAVLGVVPLVAGATHYFGSRIHTRWGLAQEELSRYTARLQEHLVGLRVLRAYTCESAEQRAMRALNRSYVAASAHLITLSAIFQPVLHALIGLSFVLVLALGGFAVRNGTLTLGQFVEFNLYVARLIWPMIAVGWVANLVQRGAASMERLERLFGEPPLAESSKPSPLRLAADGPAKLTLSHLGFAYPDSGSAALAGVSLTVAPGQRVAIVGGVGSGKSTLISVIPRLLEPDRGQVFLDDIDVLDLPLDHLRHAVALVPQGGFLFSASLRDNIALACPAASSDEVLAAALAAGLGPDLALLPDGLETVIGERGVTLSGGQRQRVAIARALLTSPRLLLLDDCLSAVDTRTERSILDALPATTLLFATHRLAAAELCDVVVVLHHCRAVEIGPPAELASRGGRYARLLALQKLEQGEALARTA